MPSPLALLLLLAPVLSFLFSPNASAQSAAGEPFLADAVVARVNSRPLLLSELKEAALDLDVPLSALSPGDLEGEGFQKAISSLVDTELLVQEAQRDGVQIDDLDISRRVDDQIQKIVIRAGGEAGFIQFLRRSHLNLDTLRRLMIRRETRKDQASAVIARRLVVSNEEIEAFRAERQAGGGTMEEVHLAHILFLCTPAERETERGEEQHKKALDAAREAGVDPSRFAEVVARHSEDPGTRNRGGNLGWLDPASIQPELAEQARGMRPGDISRPVFTERGWHVLYLLDRRDARDLLMGEKFRAERTRMLETLREQAVIELYPIRES